MMAKQLLERNKLKKLMDLNSGILINSAFLSLAFGERGICLGVTLVDPFVELFLLRISRVFEKILEILCNSKLSCFWSAMKWRWNENSVTNDAENGIE
jgi:hypothetical protein